MAYGTVNADVIGTSVANTSLGAGNASIMKNRIINGAMVIDQRNAGASVTIGAGATYTLDRWKCETSQASKMTVQQNAGSVTPPVGFANYAGITSSSAYSIVSGDYFTFEQVIEGYNLADLSWGTVNAKAVTLSAWVYSSLTGTFGGSLRNSANNYSYPFTYSIPVANTWTLITVNITAPTSGTWYTDNRQGVIVFFGLGVGSTYSGTAGSWSANNYLSATGATSVVGTNGATFYITGVQLEVGSSATGFEYVNYQTLLANCQRYYQKITDCKMIGSFSGTNTVARLGAPLMVPMRASPSMSVSGSISLYNPAVGTATITTLGGTYVSVNSFDFDATLATGSGFTNGTICIAYVSNSYSMIASAEL